MAVEKLTTIYSQHTVYLQRIGATEGLKVLPFLQAIEVDVLAILNKYRKRKLSAGLQLDIEKQIDAATKAHLQAYVRQLKTANRDIGLNEVRFAATTLNGVVRNAAFNSIVPSAAAVNAVATAAPIKLGENSYTAYSSMMNNYWGKIADEVNGIVKAGFINGSNIPEITNSIMAEMELSKSGTTKSALDRARRGAKSLAVTGTNHYANNARIAFVDQNDNILKGYRFLAVNDSRTSTRCRSLDQRVFKSDYDKISTITPPLHPNCRSALTYEVDDRFKLDKSETKKASSFEVSGKRDPKSVDSDSIYYENLKKLKDTDQDAVLGPTLGKAFRQMNARDFAKAQLNSFNEPLTIKQMKAKNNELARILNNL